MKNFCFRIISQLLYPLIFMVITLLCAFVQAPQKYTIPISKTSVFDEKKDPIWLAQMTDLHISESYPQAVANCDRAFKYIHQYIKPTFLLVTGDVADNYESSKRPCKSYQIDWQFQKYNELIKSSGVYDYAFETIGNHDVVGITEKENNEKRTNYHKYFRINETVVSTVKKTGNIRIISFNPFDFTSGTGLLNLVKILDSHYLDKLEAAIESGKQDPNDITIVISHYTTTTFYPQYKTSSGLTLGQLFKKWNIKYFINGHVHPKNLSTMHNKNGFIELTGMTSKQNDGFHIFTVDNGHSNYVHLKTDTDKPAVLTYPPPSLYENEVMKEFSEVVRIISFSNKASQFHATIENENSKEKIECSPQFVRTIPNQRGDRSARLFQCNLPKKNFNYKGKNTLRIDGDLSETIEFNVDKTYKVSEKHIVEFIPVAFAVGISLALIYHFCVVVFMFLPFKIKLFDNYTEHPILCVFAGPAITGYRFKKLQLWARIILAFFILSPIVLPCAFFTSGSDKGLMIFWGFSFNMKFHWDTFLVGLGTLYFLTVTISIEEIFIVILTSWTWFYMADIVVAAVLYAIALYAWYFFGIEVAFDGLWFASISFIILPILAIIFVSVYKPITNAFKRDDSIDEGSSEQFDDTDLEA